MLAIACSTTSSGPIANHEPTATVVATALPDVHARAGEFPLPHGKVDIPCSDCHVRRERLTANCNAATQCHDGGHEPTLGPHCTTCHPPGAWDATRFDHDQPFPPEGATIPGFALRGRHVALRCEACHPSSRDFVTAPTRCAGCHDDVHRGGRGADCERCHGETSWR